MIVNLSRYRGFIVRNALSDVRHRYAGSAVGVAWNVINALYLCGGLLPWAAFSQWILRGADP
jgi:ABC-type polysaccharide/polyol phosphate export permease